MALLRNARPAELLSMAWTFRLPRCAIVGALPASRRLAPLVTRPGSWANWPCRAAAAGKGPSRAPSAPEGHHRVLGLTCHRSRAAVAAWGVPVRGRIALNKRPQRGMIAL